MRPIIISTREFVNLVTGARLIDSHMGKLEVEKFTLDQWLIQPDVSDTKKAYGIYIMPMLRGQPNKGAMIFEEIKSAGGIQ